MFINFLISVGMGSLVVKTGSKIPLFIVQPKLVGSVEGIIGI